MDTEAVFDIVSPSSALMNKTIRENHAKIKKKRSTLCALLFHRIL